MMSLIFTSPKLIHSLLKVRGAVLEHIYSQHRSSIDFSRGLGRRVSHQHHHRLCHRRLQTPQLRHQYCSNPQRDDRGTSSTFTKLAEGILASRLLRTSSYTGHWEISRQKITNPMMWVIFKITYYLHLQP